MLLRVNHKMRTFHTPNGCSLVATSFWSQPSRASGTNIVDTYKDESAQLRNSRGMQWARRTASADRFVLPDGMWNVLWNVSRAMGYSCKYLTPQGMLEYWPAVMPSLCNTADLADQFTLQ